MKTHGGGRRVKPGFYWNLRTWTLATISDGPGDLPGDARHRYVKVPVIVLLGVAPIMGAAYVMFLPLLGFALLFGTAAAKGVAVVRKTAVAARQLAWKRAH